ncbi:hypothetical protein SAMN04488009_2840 [Maribacter sedimenticola]|uniref:General secretion pathway protein L n=1 Tax=Maribacter sedimenticola TaxID=228956 RepID=A0ABY1SJ79_9FLAO|nr:hypothetical protein [Maribacter sedimenticola]SNR63000.1 hypothetical protein SAMN04488009_2840 [Maribacter sedimenticola]
MLNKIKQHIIEGSIFAGLEINSSEKGETYNFIEIKKYNSELIISKSYVFFKMKDIKLYLKKTTPLFVSINNNSVLTKQISNSSTTTDTAKVNQAFPNLDSNDFYWELIQKSENTVISIVRKEIVESIILSLKQLDLVPFQFSLGISSIINLAPFIKNESVFLNNYKVIFDNQRIIEFKNIPSIEETLYSINGLEIPNSHLLSFAQILGFINHKRQQINFKEKNDQLRNHTFNERIFQQVTKSTLIFFAVILLINFVFYQHYFNKIAELDSTIIAHSSQKENLITLENSINKIQDRVETLSISTNSKCTFYLDVLGQSIPQTILLNNIKFQPILKSVQKKKPVIVEKNIIEVSGLTKDANGFSKWIEQLESFHWILSVETLDFEFVNSNTSKFLIEIKTNDQ